MQVRRIRPRVTGSSHIQGMTRDSFATPKAYRSAVPRVNSELKQTSRFNAKSRPHQVRPFREAEKFLAIRNCTRFIWDTRVSPGANFWGNFWKGMSETAQYLLA